MKMNNSQKEVMQSRIKSLNQQFQRIRDEEDKLRELKKEFAGFYAPLRKGAIIVIPEEAHVHRGKNGKVEECVLKYSAWGKSWRWFITGAVLKANSEVGTHRFRYEQEIDLS